MKQAKYSWHRSAKVVLPEEFQQIIQEKKISPLLGELLWQRNIQTEEALHKFLQPSAENLYDPFLFFDMDRAVERIQDAVLNGEKILIYGDYDADGITSTTIMKETLELLGAEVEFYLPNRFRDGYGPNLRVYQEKIAAGIQLIVTVDNGVSGHEAIDYANSQGVDVIITDHHELPEKLPEAYAIIHPRHPLGKYPFGDLAGVGVAFKLACALLEDIPAEFLDLVALGTVADMVSMTDENRTLVQMGLAGIKQTERIGLIELLAISGVKKSEITEVAIGFSISPRLNAIGRLEDPNPAVTLMTTFDQEEAERLASELDRLNLLRREYVDAILAESETMIDPKNEIHLLVGEDWHEGVLGIVAGRILKKTGRPTIVLTKKEEGIAKGSGRSIEALNLYQMLDGMRELFTSFGGHHAAVGLSIPVGNIPLLQEQMNAYILAHDIDLNKGLPLRIDEQLLVSDATVPFIESLKMLAPFGTDNPSPKFMFSSSNVQNARRIGSDNQHLKFLVSGEASDPLDGIGFGFGPMISEFETENLDLVGELSINEWNGVRKPQLMLEDFEVHGLQLFDYRSKRNRQALKLQDDSFLVSFAEKITNLPEEVATEIHYFSTVEELLQKLTAADYRQLVFWDSPADAELIKQIIQASRLSRVYFIFFSEDDAYLDGIGTRDQYARLYKFVATQTSVDVRYKSAAIANYLKIPDKLLIFMIRVFFELEFVTIEDGILRKTENTMNRALSESSLYQQRLKKIKTEEFLLLSDISTIKKWLIS